MAQTDSSSDNNNTYAQVFTVRGGRIVQVKEYMATPLIDAVVGPATP